MFNSTSVLVILALATFVQCKIEPLTIGLRTAPALANYAAFQQANPLMDPVCNDLLQTNINQAIIDFNANDNACRSESKARKANIENTDFPDTRTSLINGYNNATMVSCVNSLDLKAYLECYISAVSHAS